ncbi:hypothetical protein [Sphaerisporangium fuscum]|uniref:hypothetical protein n=1 Tax=Sphaerisporangium fuscum TaxID=2835868 RepID=UPI001BDD5D7E|nr:hypothetical protein [Sphaerisporangium fuscum]
MTLPVARTRDEAHLYFDLHPCERCGSVETPWEHALVAVPEGLAARYTGTCSDCGAERSHLFGLPEREVSSGGFPTFGGPEPSQIVDAGQWLWVADLTAANIPADDPAAARQALAIAIAAMEEIVKFAPPGGDRVPENAFWTELGRQVRAAEPGRFRVDRLLVVRDTYRRLADAR